MKKTVIGTIEDKAATIFEGATENLSATVKEIFTAAGLTGNSVVEKKSDLTAVVKFEAGPVYNVEKRGDKISVFTCEGSVCKRKSSKSILRRANAREQEFLVDFENNLNVSQNLTREELSEAKKIGLTVYKEVQEGVIQEAISETLKKVLPKHMSRALRFNREVIDAEYTVIQPKLLECKLKGKSKK